MTNLVDDRLPAVGAYWINEGDYATLLETFADGNKMPRTWKEWLKIARKWNGVSRPTGMSFCVYTSIRTHFQIGAPPIA